MRRDDVIGSIAAAAECRSDVTRPSRHLDSVEEIVTIFLCRRLNTIIGCSTGTVLLIGCPLRFMCALQMEHEFKYLFVWADTGKNFYHVCYCSQLKV